MNVHVEWGEQGARALETCSDVLVIVDVLSFSTAVDVAVAREAEVLPFGSRDLAAARTYAERERAVMAGRRGEGFSLSPGSLASLPYGARLVLPSPNGSAISALAAEHGCTVLVGFLRNAAAVALVASAAGGSIGVVAAGERWPDRSLRPAIEDLIGAGAIVDALGMATERSVDAELAAQVFVHARPDLLGYLVECQSGRELVQLGFRDDVELAAQLNVSDRAPFWRDGSVRS
jgi:2-phosphosulfolactate phosphatase